MATGHYSCSSNRATVTDPTAVKAVLAEYNTHSQCSFNGSSIAFSSPSDSLNISEGGQGAQIAFLTELAPYLDEELRIRNEVNPPRESPREFVLVASPEGDVKRVGDDGEETRLVPA